MKTQTLYRLEVSTVDGRGPGTVKAYTPNLKVAEKWEKESPLWHVYFKIEMIIIDSLEELRSAETERKKNAALAKLTPEERTLLGLK